MDFTVIQGNIAKQQADALVSASGTNLMMDTGAVGTALLQEAGEAINEDAVEIGPINLGEVAVTDAYGLNANYVIHAAAAHFGGESKPEHIRRAVRNTLFKAEDLECESVVLPAIGCGIAGFDIEEGAQIICQEIGDFDTTTLTDVRIIGYTDEEFEAITDVANHMQSNNGQ